MKNLIIIQARMGSSRLPGKVLMPLGDTVVLDYVVSRCRKIQHIYEVIVATSILPQDDSIEQWCNNNKVSCFRGSEDDVLARYYECAKTYKPDYVLRVTADCPFVDYEFGAQMVEKMLAQPSDIIVVNEKDFPRGLIIEMVSFKALEYMFLNGQEERHREHVTYYAKENKELFKQTFVQTPESLNYSGLRITLDTQEDYQLCQAVATYFNGNILVPSEKVIEYLLNHPEIAHINSHIEQKPVE